jgi:hypothetical protein
VPDHDGAAGGQVVPGGGEQVDARGDVQECARPPAATVRAGSDSPVVDVPDRPAAAGEVGGIGVLQGAVVAGTPVAAVDENRQARGRSLGQVQLRDLRRVPAVAVDGDPVIVSGYWLP